MAAIKDILLSVQERLGELVPELAYIDKDWGQLAYEKPAVRYPCALLDIEAITYTQEGGVTQMADGAISVRIANQRLTPASYLAPNREQAYEIINLVDKVHKALHRFAPPGYSPLFRTALRKEYGDSSKECYLITYQVAFEEGFDMGNTGKVEGAKVKINLR